jgi:hypothetical protein
LLKGYYTHLAPPEQLVKSRICTGDPFAATVYRKKEKQYACQAGTCQSFVIFPSFCAFWSAFTSELGIEFLSSMP